ncbi:MAG: hypothetical protein E7287_04845 [Lachnospiraceae bacterium]|nr:hypothetical protein [Lachnospiraceae bacterium]
MKKGRRIFSLVMALFMTLSTMFGNSGVFDVKAETGATEILKGTPLFDGQVDEMYKESLTLVTGVGDNAYATEWSDDHGNIYFLYDDTYLYICADIKDNSVCSRGELYVSQDNPFDNDCCEFRLCLNNGIDGVTPTTIKVGIDAYGIRAYGLTKDMAATDYSKIQYKTTIIEEGAEPGYVIEAAIPHTDGGILDLLNAGQLGFKLQLNDLDDDGAYRYFATDYAGEGAKKPVYYQLSDQMVTGGDVNTPPPMIEDKVEVTDYLELSMADSEQYFVPGRATGYGEYTVNTESGTLDITYGNASNWYKNRGWRYIGRLGFRVKDQYSADYPYVRVLYAADLPTGAESVTMALYDNIQSTVDYAFDPVTDTNGEFVLSSTLKMTDSMTGILADGQKPLFLMFSAAEGQNDGKYQTKSMYFFRTEEDANNFVVPSEIQELNYQKLSFATTANYYMPKLIQNYGTAEQNAEMGTLDIKYGNVDPATKWSAGSQYIGKVGFPSAGIYDPEYKYIRVLYSATNPEGVSDVVMKLSNDGGPSMLEFASKVNNTNGEFVLSSAEEMPADMLERYQKKAHMSLVFYTDKEGADYKIKAFYFFKTKEEAEQFSPDSELVDIKINANDISNYKVVVPVEGMGNEYTCAQSIVALVNQRTGVKLPIVYDSEPATEYEILVGDTNRPETSGLYDIGGRFHPSYESFTVSQYRIDRVGNKLVFVAAARECMDLTLELFAYILDTGAAEGNGTANITKEGIVARGLYPYSLMSWPEVDNVENPVQFTDGFDTDEGYWTADSEKLAQKWVFASDGDNKVLSTGDKETALSYLHVWERNVSFETKLKAAAADSGEVGLLLRHTADDAWVKAGYDFDAKEWFIDVRGGADFLRYRMASTKDVAFTADQWIDVKAVVNGATAELYVNGTKILEADDLTQLTPGRPGVYAEGVSAMVDDVNISLLSGQGTIWKDVVHTKLPDEIFREGGAVVELSDGTLVYQSRSYDLGSFFSYDGGKTWERENVGDMWSDAVGYPTFLRLQSGKLMRLGYVQKEDAGVNWERVDISTDDGETWEPVGWICPTKYGDDPNGASGGHHVNNLIQMSDGRIFFVESYDAGTAGLNGCRTFCEVYYSDDEGVTWTKSTMATFDIEGVVVEGNTQNRFAEAKILETAEGKLRMYCSHNDYGYMVYSESADNGVTWGPMQTMTDLPCSCSSMHFMRDEYADNDTTYYLVWCQNSTGEVTVGTHSSIPRSRLSVAKTTDGINWVMLGDAWHWESRYTNDNQAIQHIVDPFITVTEDYVLVGSGISEQVAGNHHAQRQHIWSVAKSTLEETTWKSDDTSHWQESTAGVKVNVTNHTSTGDNVATCTKKAVCDICGAEYGEEAHSYDTTTWKSDANGHWHECACLAKTDEAAHTPGVAATATTAQICTECGYVIAPATGETESDTTESDTTESDTTESDTTESDTTESDTTESDTTESDTTESDTTESDTVESNTAESDTSESDTSESDADPSTGDTSSMLRWIMLAAGAMVVAVFAVVSRKMKLN